MKCKLCSKKTKNLELHHIIPKSRGGSDDKTNLIKLCSKCHGLAHDVSFANDRGGLIKEGVNRVKKNYQIDLKWFNDNEDLVNNKMMDLYYIDENKHLFIITLLEQNKITVSHLRKWYEDGKVSFKTSITI